MRSALVAPVIGGKDASGGSTGALPTGPTGASSSACYVVPVDRPTVVDLFSGAGGTGLGFHQAGFRIIGAVELDPHAAETYTRNLAVDVTKTDIRRLKPSNLRETMNVNKGELDVLVGCPPCQGFSRMRNEKGADDRRNGLVLHYLRFVVELMPRFAVFENVPGVVGTKHGAALYRKLCDGLRKLGYALGEYKLDAADYGIAQHRRRVIVIAGREGRSPPVLARTHSAPTSPSVLRGDQLPWRTVRTDIGDGKYPKLRAGESGEDGGRFANHVAPATGPKVLEFIERVPPNGGSRTDVAEEYWLACHRGHDGHRDVYGRLAWDRPSNTITSGCTNPSKGRFVHPEQHRALTAREAAALQGFPDTFVFHGARIAWQIGNAVPPPLASAIATALRNQLLGAGVVLGSHSMG